MSIRVIYDAPPGSAPFALEVQGTTMVIQPPDQYWKLEEVEYIVGQRYNKYGHLVPGGEVKRKRPEWVLDEEKNKLMRASAIDKPDNSAHWPEFYWDEAKTAKYRDKFKYLKRVEDVYKNLEDEMSQLRRLNEERMLEEKRRMQFELAKLKDEFAVEKNKLQLELEALKGPVEEPVPLVEPAEEPEEPKLKAGNAKKK